MKSPIQKTTSYREQLRTNNGFVHTKEKTAHLAMAECLEDLRVNGHTDETFREMFNIFKFYIYLKNVL